MLRIYSDAGCYNGTTFAATMVMYPMSACLAFFAREYHGLPNSTQGELLGITNGLEWVLENSHERQVTLVTDNLSIGTRIVNYPKDRTVPKGTMAGLWVHTFSLLDKFEQVDVVHIEAHQEKHNPNKACDVLCAALLRPYKQGGPVCTQ